MRREVIFTVVCFFSFVITLQAQKNIVVCDAQGNTTGYYDKLDKAVEGTSNGSTIYIPGGNHLVNDIVIEKQVHIIGAGHFPTSTVATGRTQLNGNIYYISGADGSSLTGVYLTGSVLLGTSDTNRVVNNITVYRCNVNSITLSYGNYQQTGTGYYINENVIRYGIGNTFNGPASNIVITKNIISPAGSNVFHNISNMTVKNNVILTGYFWYVQNSTFENNIIRSGYLQNSAGSSDNLFSNNLYNSEAGSTNSGGAIYNISPVQLGKDSIFTNVTADYFDYSFDFHLTEYAKSKLTGTDGTEVGIYGTQNPFKDGSLPVNPHINEGEIAPTTGPDGNLQIKFKVQAQDN